MYPLKRVVLQSVLLVVLIVAAGAGVAFVSLAGTRPTRAATEKAAKIGQVTGIIAALGVGLIALPPAIRVGRQRRSKGHPAANRSGRR